MNLKAAMQFMLASLLVAVSGAAFAVNKNIDILTAYDDNALAFYGGNSAVVDAAVTTEIGILNAKLSDSAATITASKVGIFRVPTNSFYNNVAKTASFMKGYFPLQQEHDRVQADVVIVLTGFGYAASATINGGAYMDSYTAFSAVDVAALTQWGYEYEFGHILGAVDAYKYQYQGYPAGLIDPLTGQGIYVCFHTLDSAPIGYKAHPCSDPTVGWSNRYVLYNTVPTGSLISGSNNVPRMNAFADYVQNFSSKKLAPTSIGGWLMHILLW